jgi:hypothetical protein
MRTTKLQSVFATGSASIVVKALCLITCIALFMFADFASGQVVRCTVTAQSRQLAAHHLAPILSRVNTAAN